MKYSGCSVCTAKGYGSASWEFAAKSLLAEIAGKLPYMVIPFLGNEIYLGVVPFLAKTCGNVSSPTRESDALGTFLRKIETQTLFSEIAL